MSIPTVYLYVSVQWYYMEAVTYPFIVFSILSWSAVTRTDPSPTWSCREWACGCLCRTRPCSGSSIRSRTKFWPKWTRRRPSLKCCRVSIPAYLHIMCVTPFSCRVLCGYCIVLRSFHCDIIILCTNNIRLMSIIVHLLFIFIFFNRIFLPFVLCRLRRHHKTTQSSVS